MTRSYWSSIALGILVVAISVGTISGAQNAAVTALGWIGIALGAAALALLVYLVRRGSAARTPPAQ